MRLYAEEQRAREGFKPQDDEQWPKGGFTLYASEEKQNEAERLGGPAEGQQTHEMTLKLVLFNQKKMLSEHISIHDVDIRTEGGTKLRKMLVGLIPPEGCSFGCTKVKKLARKVAIHFADKSGGGSRGDYKGCSLAKLKDFETGVTISIPNAYKSLARNGQKKEYELIASHNSDPLARTQSSNREVVEPIPEAIGSQIPKASTLPTQLGILIERIVEQDRRHGSFVQEQTRSLCSREVNRQRLDVLYDLLRVPLVRFSSSPFEHVCSGVGPF